MRGKDQDFFDWTDFCRAMAAFLVTVSHVRDVLMSDCGGQKAWTPFYTLTGFGHSGVIVFFVLSGFWISRSVLRRIEDKAFWPAYLIDRLSRLGIVLVPALVLGGILDEVGIGLLHLPIYQGHSGAHSLVENSTDTLTLPTLLGNLLFLQRIVVGTWGSNGPLWSLAFEFWFYIWFPALALLIRQRRISLALLALLIGLLSPALYVGFASWLVGLLLLLCIDDASVPVSRFYLPLAAGMFAAVLLIGSAEVPLAISFGLLLLAMSRTALPFPRVMEPLARYGRTSSFSLYAIHYPVIALVGGWLARQGRLAPGTEALLLVLALTAFCLFIGWIFSRGTEAYTQPLRGWLRQRFLAPLSTGGSA